MKKGLFLLTALLSVTLYGQNALNFDGVDDYVSTTSPGVAGNAARTVEAWIRTTAITAGNQKVIVDWGSMTNGTRFTMNLLQNNSLRLEVGGNGITCTTAVNDGFWHHVAVVYDPAVSTNQIKLYIDGALNMQGNLTVSVNTSSITPVLIGRRNDGVNYFDGDIDEVRIWSTVRTASEISTNRTTEFCGTEPGLVAYYKFNQGTAGATNTSMTNLPDRSGNSNNGTLQGFSLAGTSSNWVAGPTSLMVTGSTSNTSITKTACNSYLSPAGNTYDSSGTYVDTLMGSSNCDSIITINLTVNKLDLSVTRTTTTLTANKTGVAYQWLMCGPTYTKLSGKTSQSFMPTDTTKSYAVVLSSPGCVDTSDCYKLINDIGVGEVGLPSASIYPNPSNGKFTVYAAALTDQGEISIYSSTGKLLVHQTEFDSTEVEIDLTEVQRGVYVVEINVGGEVIRKKLILE